MVIRHGEKPDGSDHGIDANGKKDESSLTKTGWDRAKRLVSLFASAQGTPRPGPVRPKAIYAAGRNDAGDGTRTRETVAPLARALGITVDTTFGIWVFTRTGGRWHFAQQPEMVLHHDAATTIAGLNSS